MATATRSHKNLDQIPITAHSLDSTPFRNQEEVLSPPLFAKLPPNSHGLTESTIDRLQSDSTLVLVQEDDSTEYFAGEPLTEQIPHGSEGNEPMENALQKITLEIDSLELNPDNTDSEFHKRAEFVKVEPQNDEDPDNLPVSTRLRKRTRVLPHYSYPRSYYSRRRRKLFTSRSKSQSATENEADGEAEVSIVRKKQSKRKSNEADREVSIIRGKRKGKSKRENQISGSEAESEERQSKLEKLPPIESDEENEKGDAQFGGKDSVTSTTFVKHDLRSRKVWKESEDGMEEVELKPVVSRRVSKPKKPTRKISPRSLRSSRALRARRTSLGVEKEKIPTKHKGVSGRRKSRPSKKNDDPDYNPNETDDDDDDDDDDDETDEDLESDSDEHAETQSRRTNNKADPLNKGKTLKTKTRTVNTRKIIPRRSRNASLPESTLTSKKPSPLTPKRANITTSIRRALGSKPRTTRASAKSVPQIKRTADKGRRSASLTRKDGNEVIVEIEVVKQDNVSEDQSEIEEDVEIEKLEEEKSREQSEIEIKKHEEKNVERKRVPRKKNVQPPTKRTLRSKFKPRTRVTPNTNKAPIKSKKVERKRRILPTRNTVQDDNQDSETSKANERSEIEMSDAEVEVADNRGIIGAEVESEEEDIGKSPDKGSGPKASVGKRQDRPRGGKSQGQRTPQEHRANVSEIPERTSSPELDSGVVKLTAGNPESLSNAIKLLSPNFDIVQVENATPVDDSPSPSILRSPSYWLKPHTPPTRSRTSSFISPSRKGSGEASPNVANTLASSSQGWTDDHWERLKRNYVETKKEFIRLGKNEFENPELYEEVVRKFLQLDPSASIFDRNHLIKRVLALEAVQQEKQERKDERPRRSRRGSIESSSSLASRFSTTRINSVYGILSRNLDSKRKRPDTETNPMTQNKEQPGDSVKRRRVGESGTPSIPSTPVPEAPVSFDSTPPPPAQTPSKLSSIFRLFRRQTAPPEIMSDSVKNPDSNSLLEENNSPLPKEKRSRGNTRDEQGQEEAGVSGKRVPGSRKKQVNQESEKERKEYDDPEIQDGDDDDDQILAPMDVDEPQEPKSTPGRLFRFWSASS